MTLLERYTVRIREEARNLVTLKDSADYSKILQILDDLEMDPYVTVDEYKEFHLIVHLLAHILVWDDLNAKFLWKRVQSGIKKNDVVKGFYDVVKYIIRKEFDKIIPKLAACWKSVQGDETLAILCEKAIAVARYNLARTITKYYTNISLKEIANIFSFTEKEAELYLLELGWQKIDDSYIQTPQKLDVTNHEFKKLLASQFNQTSNTISFLETI